MDTNRRVTRSYAKSMEEMNRNIGMEHETARGLSESELNSTVRQIDESLLRDNQDETKVAAVCSKLFLFY